MRSQHDHQATLEPRIGPVQDIGDGWELAGFELRTRVRLALWRRNVSRIREIELGLNEPPTDTEIRAYCSALDFEAEPFVRRAAEIRRESR